MKMLINYEILMTRNPNFCAMVGDLAEGTIKCLGDEVDGADEFAGFCRCALEERCCKILGNVIST